MLLNILGLRQVLRIMEEDRIIFFVVLDDVQPLNTLEGRLEELKQHLLSEHFTLEDDVADVVGGLRVW